MKKLLIVYVALNVCTSLSMQSPTNAHSFDKLLLVQAQSSARSNKDLYWLPSKIELISKSDDINAVDDLGNTRLHYAAFLGQIPTMRLLIELGADILKKNKNNQDSFMVLDDIVSQPKSREMANMLELQYKALLQMLAKMNINQVYNHGFTVLHMAAMRQHVDLVEEFLALGAKPNAQSSAGGTPLHFAAITFSNENDLKYFTLC